MTLTTFFGICALIGTTIMVFQFVMMFIGLDGADDADATDGLGDDIGDDGIGDVDHQDSTHVFQIISFRTVVAALAFFGLAGLASTSSNIETVPSLGIAVVTGLAAMYGVYWTIRSMRHLRADGTARIQRAIGQSGTVYLRIPAHRAGSGKVTVELRDRTMEYEAITSDDELLTGAKVVVTGVVGPDTVEVEPAP